MKTWRMSFRAGNQGSEVWPDCLRLGIAAITYRPLACIDLSEYPRNEPKNLWAKLASSQKASLRRVAYEMKKGDEIYVKQGRNIIGKGVVKGSYHFAKYPLTDWPHQIPVKWEINFPEINILLGAEQLTVKELSQFDLKKLEAAIDKTLRSNNQKEASKEQLYKKINPIYVCFGAPDTHLQELKELSEKNSITYWTINPQAKVNDRALFYITGPISSFVA